MTTIGILTSLRPLLMSRKVSGQVFPEHAVNTSLYARLRHPWLRTVLERPVRLLFCSLVVLLVGCSSGHDWNGKDISGLMPELAFELTDSNGETYKAEDGKGTVRVMFFGFTNCPDICPTTMARLKGAINQMPDPLQDDVTMLFVSVDPRRDTPEKLGEYVGFFGDDIKGLTSDEKTLRKLAKRYRTTFGYNEPDENGDYDVSHSSAVYVFDEEGRARLLLRSQLSRDEISEDLTTLAREAAG